MDLLECEWAMLESIRDEGPVDLPFDSVQGLTRYHLLTMEEKNGAFWWSLSRDGRRLLEDRKKEAEQAASQAREKEAARAEHLKERCEDHAEAERRHVEQKKVTIVAAVLSSLLSFVAGVILEHSAGIVRMLQAAWDLLG